MTDEQPLCDALAGKTREQIIDHWMQDKLFYQGQVRRLQNIVRELYALHGQTHQLFLRAAMDVVFEEQVAISAMTREPDAAVLQRAEDAMRTVPVAVGITRTVTP